MTESPSGASARRRVTAFVQFAHLAEVDEAQRLGAADGALGRLDFAAQQAQKRGLAAAVGADKAHFGAGREDEIQAR